VTDAISENEDRDRMISQAMTLLLASSRVSHILHDAVLEIDTELSRLRAEIERLLEENLELKMRPVFDEYREYRA